MFMQRAAGFRCPANRAIVAPADGMTRGRGLAQPMQDADVFRKAFEDAFRQHQAGRLDEAERQYNALLEIAPADANCLHLLGVLNSQRGRFEAAVGLIRKAIAIRPNVATYHSNLGVALNELGRADEAAACFRRALELKPDYPEAHVNLGIALKNLDRLDDAVASYRKALELKPDYVDAHINLGVAFKTLGRLDEAVASYQRAIDLRPSSAEAHNNLAVSLQLLGRFDEAMAAIHRGLALKPDNVRAYLNLGVLLHEEGRLDEAVASYRKALELKPDDPETHWNLSHTLFLQGNYERGWEELEWRWRYADSTLHKSGDLTQPKWSGERADGRTMLIWAEYGFGDNLQFVRYAPAVARLGWRVILEMPRQLKRVCASIDGIEVIATDEPLPDFDMHCPVLSLPRVFGTGLSTIPADIPYLRADRDLVRAWRERLAGRGGLKVGVTWRGNPLHPRDRARSMTPAVFAGLLDVPGLAIVNLQKDARPEEIAALGPPGAVLDAGSDLGDFADTAALVANLDLVVAVDTSVCHLAGALGMPTWILLDSAPDWRWMLDRDDTPWYPTVRLFRQAKRGNWQGVVDRVRVELARLVQRSAGR